MFECSCDFKDVLLPVVRALWDCCRYTEEASETWRRYRDKIERQDVLAECTMKKCAGI